MKYEDKKNLIIIFIMIVFLAAISIWRFERFEEAMVEIELPEIEMPEIKFPELDELNLEDFDLRLEDLGLEIPKPLTLEEIKQDYETFISPDKTIQMKYPAHWQKIDQIILEKANQKMKELGLEQKNFLFFAHQARLIEHPPLLTIVSMPPEMGLEQVIEETKRIAKEQQMEIEIIKKGFKNNKAYFEAEYKKEFQDLFLKGKIVFTEERNYLISILAPAELQEQMIPEIDFIFDSIEII